MHGSSFQPQLRDDVLLGIWGSSRSNVFVVGFPGVAWHFDGSDWMRMTLPTRGGLYCVWGDGRGSVFAGGQGIVFHYWLGED